MKRLAVAASVSVLAIIGIAPAASAAPRTHHQHVAQIIDWDAPQPIAPGGGFSTRAIDWD